MGAKILVLGVGNTLHSDDGAGVRAVEALRRDASLAARGALLLDVGTIGLALLPEVQDADAVIVMDAGDFGAPPGAVRCFEGAEMDARLRGKQRTAHEVAVSDLFAAAELSGHLPPKRALVAIQPASTDWGVEPTRQAQEGIALACDAARALIGRWTHE